jgi:hypothetical protein
MKEAARDRFVTDGPTTTLRIGAFDEPVRQRLAAAYERLGRAVGYDLVPGGLDHDVAMALKSPGRKVSLDLANRLEAATMLHVDELEADAGAAVAEAQSRIEALGGDATLDSSILAPVLKRVVEKAGTVGMPGDASALESAAYKAVSSEARGAGVTLAADELAGPWLQKVAALTSGRLPVEADTLVDTVRPLQDASLASRPLTDRLARVDRTIAAVLDETEGTGKDMSWSPRLSAALADLVDTLTAARTEEPWLAPMLRDDIARGELDRSLALTSRVLSKGGKSEHLWPDRGRIGRVMAGTRTAQSALEGITGTM